MNAFALAIVAVLALGQEVPPEAEPDDEQVDLNAQLTVKALGVKEPADVWIDGQLAGKSGEAIAVTAGEHRVVVSAPKKMDVTFRTTLKKDGKKSLTVRLADGVGTVGNRMSPGDFYMPNSTMDNSWTSLDRLPLTSDATSYIIDGKLPGAMFELVMRAWQFNARHVQSFEYYIYPGTQVTAVEAFRVSGLPTSAGTWHTVAFVHAETLVLQVDNKSLPTKQLGQSNCGIKFKYPKGTKGKIILSNFEYVALPELPAVEGK